MPWPMRFGPLPRMTTRGVRRRRRRLVGLAPGRVVVGRRSPRPRRRTSRCGGRRARASAASRRSGVDSARARARTTGAGSPGSRGRHGVARRVELAAPRLHERLAEGAADPHRLADRLHLRAERRVGARELLEGEARELHDDVVERRLEARRRRPRQVVRDLVERVADCELRRDLRDRIAGRLRRERGRARDARVHLDHADLAGLAVARELDVRAAVSTPTARMIAIAASRSSW